MDDRRFDQITRALSSGADRRRLLAGLAGGLAAAFGGRKATRAQDINDCARFCTEVLPPGPQRGRCNSQAAQGEGPCIECGADADSVCVTADGAVACEFAACGTGRVCLAGACVGTGTCTPGSTNAACSTTCSGTFNACRQTTEGVTVCVVGISCSSAVPCTASSQCQPGEVCASGGVCGGTVCRAVCGAPSASSAAAVGPSGIDGQSDPPLPE
jgi:hypothetical protein